MDIKYYSIYPQVIAHIIAHTCATALLCLFLINCNAVSSLRQAFHPEEQSTGSASLVLEITPKENITILLDEKRVGNSSPLTLLDLTVGPHTLEIRAMGYHSFSVDLELADNQTISMPIAMRARKTTAPSSHVGNLKSGKQRRANKSHKNTARYLAKHPITTTDNSLTANTKFAPAPRISLVKPIVLLIGGASAKGIAKVVDDVTYQGRRIELQYSRGELAIGPMMFTYRFSKRGTLLLKLHRDDAQWQSNNEARISGEEISLDHGALKLQRLDPNGSEFSIFIKR